jgi:putative two-component system response regulator
MVEAFIGLQEEFRAIAARFHDTDHDMAEKKAQIERLTKA